MLNENQIRQSSEINSLSELVKRLGKLAWHTIPGTSLYDLGKRVGEIKANNERKPSADQRVRAYCFAFGLDAGKTYVWYGLAKAAYSLIENLF